MGLHYTSACTPAQTIHMQSCKQRHMKTHTHTRTHKYIALTGAWTYTYMHKHIPSASLPSSFAPPDMTQSVTMMTRFALHDAPIYPGQPPQQKRVICGSALVVGRSSTPHWTYNVHPSLTEVTMRLVNEFQHQVIHHTHSYNGRCL